MLSPKKKSVRSNSLTSQNTRANRNQPLELMFTTPRTSSASADSAMSTGKSVKWADGVNVIDI